MYTGQNIFAQVMSFLPWKIFTRIVSQYGGDRRVRSLSCTEQYRIMAFAQLTNRRSLRDTVDCLRALPNKLYHSGLSKAPVVSTVSRANESRNWRIFADFSQRLIAQARTLYSDKDLALELDETVYALDSSTIDLCLSVFPWAPFRSTKAAIKLHTLLDLRGSIPTFIHISDGKLHDVKALDLIHPEAGSIYVMDRAYVDFKRLYSIHQAGAFFVTRAKKKLKFHRVYSAASHKDQGIISDQTIRLDGRTTRKSFPESLRRIRFKDPESGKTLVFLTNRKDLESSKVCALYKQRWQVELFFKWIKQHLRIQRFFGFSENAVKSQIWIAVSVYVLLAVIRHELKLTASMHTILQVLSVIPFEQVPLYQAFTESGYKTVPPPSAKQLILFDL